MLRRKPEIRTIDTRGYNEATGVLENEDLPWLYAGYRLGAFEGHMPKGLNEEAFIDALLDLTSRAHEIYVGIAPLDRRASQKRGGHQIVNIISVGFSEHRGEPHAIWMPWASAKNKLEVAAKFFAEMRREHNMIVPVREEDKGMFRHLCRLGLMRHVGKIDRYFSDGDTALVFQTLGVKNA